MVYRDKIVNTLLDNIYEMNILPVIIKTKENKYYDVLESIKPYIFIPKKILENVQIDLSSIFPRFREIKSFNMIAGILPRELVFDLAEAREVEKIFPDKIMNTFDYPKLSEGIFEIEKGIFNKKEKITSTYYTKKLIGADIANIKGYNGSGIRVGVIDTGTTKTHPMLRQSYKYTVMKSNIDENGHGTWCCSCVGGKYAVDKRFKIPCEGMAPNVWLYAVKALGHLIGTGSTSGILKAIELSSFRLDVDVISMSLGGKSEEEKPEDDPYYHIFDIITKNGIVPVVAAGNSGPKENTIGTPGCLPNVLTVGAYDPINGTIADFSSRGPTNWNKIKPDCVAPGVNIHSATNGLLDKAGDGKINRYSPLSGTSMATPHISGLVSLMKQAHLINTGRTITLCEIKRMLKELGHEKNNKDGYGVLDWFMYEKWMETEYGVKL